MAVPADTDGGPGKRVWVKVPTPDAVIDDIVWHYTSADGLLGILKSSRMRASSAAMLNDATELTHGLGLAHGVLWEWQESPQLTRHQSEFAAEVLRLSDLALRNNNVLVVCASAVQDDLAQWRAYASGAGYALGLRTRPSLRLVDETAMGRVPYRAGQTPALWRRVIYKPEQQRLLLRQTFDYLAEFTPGDRTNEYGLRTLANGINALSTVIAHMKHDGFSSEEEVRLVFDVIGLERVMDVRLSPRGMTPFADVAAGLDAEATTDQRAIGPTTREPGPLPVERVLVGPGHDQESSARGLRAALPLLGYADVEVMESRIPYR